MRKAIAPAMAVLSMLVLTAVAIAAPYAGEQYAGVMTKSVNSGSAYVGEPVTIDRVTSQNGSVAGATMYGRVTSVQHAGQGKPGKVQMTFNRLVLRNGTTYAVAGVVTGMQSSTKNNALKEAGGALAGMIVGNIIGKSIFHMSGGVPGFLGAAGGFLIAHNNKQNVTVPAGSTVRVRIANVRRQAGR